MSRKKLIVSGDSWTAGVISRDENRKPLFLTDPIKTVNHEFTLWSEYLADMLGMDVVNVALGGTGNEFIYNSIVIYLIFEENRKFMVQDKKQKTKNKKHNFIILSTHHSTPTNLPLSTLHSTLTTHQLTT